jgi:hypothetical protein
MLPAQAWAVLRLAAGPDDAARRALSVLGGVMLAGYLGERSDRHRLTPGGLDPVETLLAVLGIAGSAAMVLLGIRPLRGGQDGGRP